MVRSALSAVALIGTAVLSAAAVGGRAQSVHVTHTMCEKNAVVKEAAIVNIGAFIAEWQESLMDIMGGARRSLKAQSGDGDSTTVHHFIFDSCTFNNGLSIVGGAADAAAPFTLSNSSFVISNTTISGDFSLAEIAFADQSAFVMRNVSISDTFSFPPVPASSPAIVAFAATLRSGSTITIEHSSFIQLPLSSRFALVAVNVTTEECVAAPSEEGANHHCIVSFFNNNVAAFYGSKFALVVDPRAAFGDGSVLNIERNSIKGTIPMCVGCSEEMFQRDGGDEESPSDDGGGMGPLRAEGGEGVFTGASSLTIAFNNMTVLFFPIEPTDPPRPTMSYALMVLNPGPMTGGLEIWGNIAVGGAFVVVLTSDPSTSGALYPAAASFVANSAHAFIVMGTDGGGSGGEEPQRRAAFAPLADGPFSGQTFLCNIEHNKTAPFVFAEEEEPPKHVQIGPAAGESVSNAFAVPPCHSGQRVLRCPTVPTVADPAGVAPNAAALVSCWTQRVESAWAPMPTAEDAELFVDVAPAPLVPPNPNDDGSSTTSTSDAASETPAGNASDTTAATSTTNDHTEGTSSATTGHSGATTAATAATTAQTTSAGTSATTTATTSTTTPAVPPTTIATSTTAPTTTTTATTTTVAPTTTEVYVPFPYQFVVYASDDNLTALISPFGTEFASTDATLSFSVLRYADAADVKAFLDGAPTSETEATLNRSRLVVIGFGVSNGKSDPMARPDELPTQKELDALDAAVASFTQMLKNPSTLPPAISDHLVGGAPTYVPGDGSTATPTTAPADGDDDDDDNIGLIIGIVVAVVVVLLIAIVVICCLCRREKSAVQRDSDTKSLSMLNEDVELGHLGKESV